MSDAMALLALLTFLAAGTALVTYRPRRRARPSPYLKAAFLSAAACAVRCGEECVTPTHLLLALLLDEQVAATFQASRVPASSARERLRRLLPTTGGAAHGAQPRPSPLLLAILARAHVRAKKSRRTEITPLDVLEAMRTTDRGALAELLHEADLNVVAAEADARRGTAADRERSATGPATVIVRVWNDEKSTMEGVVRVLRESFELGEDEAQHAMFVTHEVGSARVGAFAEADAHDRVERGTRAARALGMPLRFTVDSSKR